MMTDILTKAPMYAWPLFAYLMFIGIKASKPNTISIVKLFIAPAAFFVWASYSILMRTDLYQTIVLLEGLIAGAIIGYLLAGYLPLRVDRANKLIELPGTWLTLILALSIFNIKFGLGTAQSVYPELTGTWMLIVPELVAAIISGIFVGRGLGIWRIYRSSKTNLTDAQ